MVVRDLDSLAAGVWHDDSRSFFIEAVRCHQGGAQRAAVVACWTAVCVDVLAKVEYLASEGEPQARTVLGPIQHARAQGGSAAVDAVRKFERSLVDTADGLGLVDDAGELALTRLHDDRHRCAHPSVTISGYFVPSPELVRAHLTGAVDAILGHPPVQGRIAAERFQTFLTGDGAVDPDYFRASFWRIASAGARRGLVDLAAKAGLGVIDPPPPDGAADRAVVALALFAGLDPSLVADRLKAAAIRLRGRSSEDLLRATARCGPLQQFWESVPDDVVAQLRLVLGKAGTMPSDCRIGVLALAGTAAARDALPELEALFDTADVHDKSAAIARNASPWFSPTVPALLASARGFRTAEEVGRDGVLPMAHLMTLDDLAAVLRAWAENNQCSSAALMVDYAADLFERTRRLLPDALPHWEQFLGEAATADPSDWYSYKRLRQLVAAAR